MDGDAVNNIANLAQKPQLLGGFLYRPDDWVVEDPASLVKPGPQAAALKVSTLGAVRDYLVANKDGLDLARLVVHVASPTTVYVLGPLDGRARVREGYVTAGANDLTHDWLGTYHSIEQFLIGLQIRFVDADDRGKLLALLSTVKSEKVTTAIDDGMTQVVEARAGVALVANVAVPNPVLLSGYRTFRDVVQPSTLYVLRVQDGKAGGLPTVALFEADGGAWRLQAIARVREWLQEALLKEIAVLA